MRLRQRTQSVSYAELDDIENDTPVEPGSSKGKAAVVSTPRRKKRRTKDDEEEEDEFVAEGADDQEEEEEEEEFTTKEEDDDAPLANDSDISDVVASDPEFSTLSKKPEATRGVRRKKKLEAAVVPVASWSLAVLGPKMKDIITELNGVDERKVYEDVRCRLDDCYIVDETKAQSYMPNRTDPVSIRLGLSPDPVQLPSYSSYSLKRHVPRRTAYILNTGGSIWGLDWCPKPAASVDDPHVQYLAVGGYTGTTDEHHAIGERAGRKGAIQVWKIDCRLGSTDQDESRRPTLQLCIMHDYGCVWDMKWCPYGTYEPDVPQALEEPLIGTVPKLGVLAVAFGDGVVRMFAVPHPRAMQRLARQEKGEAWGGVMNVDEKVVYVKYARPLCEFTIPETSCLTIAWGGHRTLLAGYTNGNGALWDVERALNTRTREEALSGTVEENSADPLIAHFPAHDSCLRSVAWHGIADPTMFATVGHDGRLLLFDSRDPWTSMSFFRVRAFVLTTAWPSHMRAVLFTDSDNVVRCVRTSDGQELRTTTGLLAHRGSIWSVAASERHPFVASASSDGWVRMGNAYQVRTRSARPTQVTLYKLEYDEERRMYRYVDGIRTEEIAYNGSKEETVFYLFISPEASVQRVCWNPNADAAPWIASGGAAGLCRVEFTGRGPEWEEKEDASG